MNKTPNFDGAKCIDCGKELHEPPGMWAARKRAPPVVICKECWYKRQHS